MSGVEEVYLLVSAGRGPRECAWAVAELVGRLEAEACLAGVRVRRADAAPAPDAGTFRSVLLAASGRAAGAFVDGWSGTLCWQAPSPYRPATGRKNWYVIARRLPPAEPGRDFDEDDVDVVACRTGGPGGQHRNKASTAVRATHRPSGAVVVVDTERQFTANRRIAVRLLRERIEEGAAAARRAATADRWTTHDLLVRGDPARVERPGGR